MLEVSGVPLLMALPHCDSTTRPLKVPPGPIPVPLTLTVELGVTFVFGLMVTVPGLAGAGCAATRPKTASVAAPTPIAAATRRACARLTATHPPCTRHASPLPPRTQSRELRRVISRPPGSEAALTERPAAGLLLPTFR